MNNRNRGLNNISFVSFFIMLVIVVYFATKMQTQSIEVTFSEFEKIVASGQIENVEVYQNKTPPTGYVDFEVKQSGEEGGRQKLYVSDVNDIQDYLNEKGITYHLADIAEESWVVTVLLPMFLTGAFILFMFMLMNRQAGGGATNRTMNFGKSRAVKHDDKNNPVTFANVAGL